MKKNELSTKSSEEKHDFMTALKNLENKVEGMFHNLWHRSPKHEDKPDLFSFNSLTVIPKIDVIDRDKEMLVKAELPGIDKEDLDISITDNQLVIKAKTCHEKTEEKGDYYRQEINKSEIYRSVFLPAEVGDDNKIKTSFKNGVLELTIPKDKKSHRRRIEVK